MRVRALLVSILTFVAFTIVPLHRAEGEGKALLIPDNSAGLCALCVSAVNYQAEVVMLEHDVAPRFPEAVDFTLKTSGFMIERAELNYRLVGEAVTVGVEAALPEATDMVDTSVNLDLRVSYIPPGAEVTYYWKLTSPGGEVVETPVKTFVMEDEGFNWRDLTDEKGRVRVHWYDGDGNFGQSLLATASAALDRLEEQIGARLERRAEIWVYANGEELFEALPLHQPEWVGGQAYPALGVVMAAIRNNELAELEIKQAIPHEISHLVLYQATKNPYNAPPAWLDEGLAVHNQEVRDPLEQEVLREAAEGGWLVPLRALSGSFGADEDKARLSYAQSGSVVEFILEDRRYGADALAKTVAAFREGVTYDDALKAGLGITTDQVDEQWRDSLPYQVAPPGGTPGNNTRQDVMPQWVRTLLFITLAALATLFLAGGLATIWAVGRGQNVKRKT